MMLYQFKTILNLNVITFVKLLECIYISWKMAMEEGSFYINFKTIRDTVCTFFLFSNRYCFPKPRYIDKQYV